MAEITEYTNKRTGEWLTQQVSSYGKNPTCGIKQLLLDLYYKQNGIKNQDKSYKTPHHDSVVSNKDVAGVGATKSVERKK